MKKIGLLLCLLFTFSQKSNAQIHFGLKGGVNFSSNSIKNVSNNVSISQLNDKSGFHAGAWLRIKIPVIGVYIRPELVYTQLKNNITYKKANDLTAVIGSTGSYNFQKIDIPVLLGKKIFGIGNVFIGPSFQYVLSSDFGISNFKDIKSNGFTVGLQFGGGIEFGKLGIDVRWERNFSNFKTNFVDVNDNDNLSFDTRVNQIIIGLSYRL